MNDFEIMEDIKDFLEVLEKAIEWEEDATTKWLLSDLYSSVVTARNTYSLGFMSDEMIVSIMRFKVNAFETITQPTN